MKRRLNSLAWMRSVTSGGNLAPSLQWSMVVAASCWGRFSAAETSQERGKDDRRKVQRSFMKTCSRALRTSDWGRRFTFQQDNAGVASGQVYECPWVAQPEPWLEPENSCAATLPIQPDRAWENLQRRMGGTPQIKVCQTFSHTQEDEAVIAAKGASTKYWVKGLNTCVNVIFLFFYFV